MAEMHPNLVGAAGFQLNLQQCAVILLFEHLVMGHRPLSVLPDGTLDAKALGSADGQVDGAADRQANPLAHGVVGAADAVLRQQFFQPVGRKLVFCTGHQTGGAPVQSVDGPEGGVLPGFGQMVHHPVAQGVAVIMSRAGMYCQTGRLVEDHQVAVLIDDVQRPFQSLHPPLFAAVRLPQDGQYLSRLHGVTHGDPGIVQHDAVFRDLQLPQQIGGHTKLPAQQGEHLQPVVFGCADILQPLHVHHLPAS